MTKMLICLTGSAFILAGCLGNTTTKLVSPSVPSELRQPVEKPTRQTNTLKDVGLLITDYDEALTEANSRIGAVDEILTNFETRIGEAGG